MANLGRFTVSAGLLAGLTALPCVCAAADVPRASLPQQTYCRAYAESEYQHAVDAGAAFPDAAYEGAGEECELQWLMLGVQWDDPANLDRLAVLGLRAGVQ